MIRKGMAALLLAATTASLGQAQEVARLRWQPGQVLVYKVEESIVTTEIVGDAKVETKTQLSVVKRWQVLSVAPTGAATVQLTIPMLKFEFTPPGGDPMRFDSANPEKSTPDAKAQMSKLIGVPVAVLLVDPQGRVEVKESKFGPASRYESEPPFPLLPTEGLKLGLGWERSFNIAVEPQGEKVAAVRRYSCKSLSRGLATIALTTELAAPPAEPKEQMQLLGMQPEGEVVFDLNAGRMQSSTLKVNKEVKGFEGEKSSYRYQRSYTEQSVEDR
jgi:hypothetical protein